MKSNKFLDMSIVDKKASILEETFIATVQTTEGEELVSYDLEIDKIFSKIKINNVITEIIMNTKGVDLGSLFTPYLFLLIIKNFTSLGDTVPNDLEGQLKALEKLIETGFLTLIIEEMPKDEIEKIFDAIKTTTKSINDNIDSVKRMSEDLELENKEMKSFLK